MIILNCKCYNVKCFKILGTKQFRKLGKDPRKTIEKIIKEVLQSIKNVFLEYTNKMRIQPTKSGLFKT